jgi:hypothetical protein
VSGRNANVADVLKVIIVTRSTFTYSTRTLIYTMESSKDALIGGGRLFLTIRTFFFSLFPFNNGNQLVDLVVQSLNKEVSYSRLQASKKIVKRRR